MIYSFHPEAEAELANAIDYYEDCHSGLGFDFALQVKLAIDMIMLYPEAWPEIEKHIRRILIKRFPYGILYNLENETITILAIMNLHREPGYWRERTK